MQDFWGQEWADGTGPEVGGQTVIRLGGLQGRDPEARLARGSPLPRASTALWGLCQERSCLVVQTAQRANPEAPTTGSGGFQKGDVAPWALGPTGEHP